MKSKLFSLIVSVLAAMCLWVYVMTVVNPDVDLTIGNIPVTFSGRHDHLYRRAPDPQVRRGAGRFLQRQDRRGLYARQHQL